MSTALDGIYPETFVELINELRRGIRAITFTSDALLMMEGGKYLLNKQANRGTLNALLTAVTIISAIITTAIGFFYQFAYAQIYLLPGLSASSFEEILPLPLAITAMLVSLLFILRIFPNWKAVKWNYIHDRIQTDLNTITQAIDTLLPSARLQYSTDEQIEEVLNPTVGNTTELELFKRNWQLSTSRQLTLPTISLLGFLGSGTTLLPIGNGIFSLFSTLPTNEIYQLALGSVLLVIGLVSGVAYLLGAYNAYRWAEMTNLNQAEKYFSYVFRRATFHLFSEIGDQLTVPTTPDAPLPDLSDSLPTLRGGEGEEIEKSIDDDTLKKLIERA